jgi:hypothetical protein
MDLHICDNCESLFGTDDLMNIFPGIPSLSERLDPGGTVPSGECPDCGALVYNFPGPYGRPVFFPPSRSLA